MPEDEKYKTTEQYLLHRIAELEDSLRELSDISSDMRAELKAYEDTQIIRDREKVESVYLISLFDTLDGTSDSAIAQAIQVACTFSLKEAMMLVKDDVFHNFEAYKHFPYVCIEKFDPGIYKTQHDTDRWYYEIRDEGRCYHDNVFEIPESIAWNGFGKIHGYWLD